MRLLLLFATLFIMNCSFGQSQNFKGKITYKLVMYINGQEISNSPVKLVYSDSTITTGSDDASVFTVDYLYENTIKVVDPRRDPPVIMLSGDATPGSFEKLCDTAQIAKDTSTILGYRCHKATGVSQHTVTFSTVEHKSTRRFSAYLAPIQFLHPRGGAGFSIIDNNGFGKIALRATETLTTNQDGDEVVKEWTAISIEPAN